MRHVRALNQELAIHLDVLQGCLGIDPVELRKDAFDLIHVDESVFVAVFAVHLCRNSGTEARDRDGVEKEASVFLYLVILVPWNMLKGILPDVQFPFDNGKEILQQNWDFIARYYLCEYYEGE